MTAAGTPYLACGNIAAAASVVIQPAGSDKVWITFIGGEPTGSNGYLDIEATVNGTNWFKGGGATKSAVGADQGGLINFSMNGGRICVTNTSYIRLTAVTQNCDYIVAGVYG